MGKKKNHRIPQQRNAKSLRRKSTRTPQTLRKPTRPGPKTQPQQKKEQKKEQKAQEAAIPYTPASRILLVGEGDFSFSVSLLIQHLSSTTTTSGNIDTGIEIDEDGVYNGDGAVGGSGVGLIATSYDTETALLEKYPQSAANVKLLREHGVAVLHGVDATKFEKMPKTLRKRRGRFDVVGFMFPHVGGLSTDLGRQVKSNQELLLGFFKSSTSLLSPTGVAVVTLFEGSPYDLWDIKSLAKSAGLRTRRSFKFQSGLYPGYKHARTLGNVEGNGTAWKGEERRARTYVFEFMEDKGSSGEKTGANTIKIGRVKANKKERRFEDASSDERNT